MAELIGGYWISLENPKNGKFRGFCRPQGFDNMGNMTGKAQAPRGEWNRVCKQ